MAAWREHSPEHLARRGHARLVLYSFCLLSGSVPQADRRAIIGHAEPCLLSMIKIRIIRVLVLLAGAAGPGPLGWCRGSLSSWLVKSGTCYELVPVDVVLDRCQYRFSTT